MQQIIIIGNGISGVSAALELRKLSTDKITIISDESDYFFARTALMYIFMGKLHKKDVFPYPKDFWKKNNIELTKALVKSIDFEEKKIYFVATSSDEQHKKGGEMNFDKLVLALGSKPNTLPILKRPLLGIQNFYSLTDVDKIKNDIEDVSKVCVVGGGLIGVELAEMFLSKGIEVHLLIREKYFGSHFLPEPEAAWVSDYIRRKGVKLYVEAEVGDILNDENSRISGIKTHKGLEISCGFLALAIGVSPNKDLVRLPQGNTVGRAVPEFVFGQGGLKLNRGILVNEYLETAISDVYAVGDCAELTNPPFPFKSIEANWYVGRLMGETAARNLVGKKEKFQPKIYFNSAKFFDLEYQVYGHIPKDSDQTIGQFFWKSDTYDAALRFAFDADTMALCGVHALGIRLRQKTCETWILEKKNMDFIVENLGEVDFNPEFSKKYFNELVNLYNHTFSKNIKIQRKTNFLTKIFSIR